MDTDLRIPVTVGQKETIQQAAELAQSDMAPWARQILLEAAKREIVKTKDKTQNKPIPYS